MSLLLVRIYLCAAIFNFIFLVQSSTVNEPVVQKRNVTNVVHNIENSTEPSKCKENEEKVPSKEKLSETSGAEKRALAAGDSFSPSEMWPIAQRLFIKVREPGNGHGFVSSTFSPEELADKLFEAFFLTTKRIIFLKDEDLPGLDALQALALSGETANLTQVEDVMETTETTYLRSSTDPKKCKYKLISKNVTKANRSTPSINRRRINLTRYLNKKRHLVVNQQRRNNKYKILRKNWTKMSRTVSTHLRLFRKGNPSQSKNETCRWKYICENIVDLDTCQIHPECNNDTTNRIVSEFPAINKSDAQALANLNLRRMLGIFYVDEEVEKILESRNLNLKRQNPNAAEVERVESLVEYFNNIIVKEQLGVTKSQQVHKMTGKYDNRRKYATRVLNKALRRSKEWFKHV